MGAHPVSRSVAARAVGVVLLAALFCAPPAPARTLLVGSGADAGPGSLRRAIVLANRTPAPDRIEIRPAAGPRIQLGATLPTVTAPLRIVGPGPGRLTISGDRSFGLLDLEVGEEGTVGIEGLTLRGGVAADGGAIVGFDTVIGLRDADLLGNEATNSGGAISLAGGELRLHGVRLAGNRAAFSGGAVQLQAAALAVRDSNLRDNAAGSSGGAIYASEPRGPLLVESSTISANRAGGEGGGIAVHGAAGAHPGGAALAISGSRVSGNSAAAGGDDVFPPPRAAGAAAPDRAGPPPASLAASGPASATADGPAAAAGPALPPASAGSNGTTTGPSAAANPNSIIRAPLQGLSPGSAGSTAMLLNGIALAPPDAPPRVKGAIDAANMISATPYLWGGGHGSWYAPGYDCSGAVSFALRGGGFLATPLASGQLASWGAPGPGRWITVYANPGHVYAVIAGLRWDTSGDARGSGPRWHVDGPYPEGFAIRHPPGY